MKTDLNNALKGSLILLIVFVMSFLVVLTNQISNTAATSNTISFGGEGEILAKPDIAILNLTMVTEAETSKAAQDENSEKSQRVVSYFKGQGVNEKDVKTSSYNIAPLYQYPGPRFPGLTEPRIYGYRVSQTLTVKVRNLDKISDILDGVVTAGVNQVDNLSFQIDDPEELKSQAREIAIKDAKDKAKKLKNQLDINLGKIVNYSESGYQPVVYRGAALNSALEAAPGPAVPTGENEIRVNVTLTYQIK